MDRDVGVDARGDLAEHLHQRVLAEGDRRVGLLAARRASSGPRCRGRGPAARWKAQPVAAARPTRAWAKAAATAPSPGGRAARRRRARARSSSSSHSPMSAWRDALLRLGVERQRQLVELGRPVVVASPRRARSRRAGRGGGSGSSPTRRTPVSVQSRPLPPNQRASAISCVRVVGHDRCAPPRRSVGEPQPEEAVAAQGEQVGQLADRAGTARRRAARRGPCPPTGAGRARPAAGSGTGC